MNRGVWWATVHMAAKNLIGLKRLSMNMLHFHIIVVFPILFPMKSFFLLPARKKKKKSYFLSSGQRLLSGSRHPSLISLI